MTKLGWSYEQFMDSTFNFYFGIYQQWLISNGAKRKTVSVTKPEEREILTFDQLPDGYW